jgi:hypothetical protein
VKTPEGRVKDDVRKRLRQAKAYYCMPVQTGFGNNNMLDFIACVPATKACEKCGHPALYGQFVSIETKAFRNVLTGRQRRTRSEIRKAGGYVFVVRSDKRDPKRFIWER